MLFKLLLSLIFFKYSICFEWPCSIENAIESFDNKILLHPFPDIEKDPYYNRSNASIAVMNKTLINSESVCALSYSDSSRNYYILRDFPSKLEAETFGFIVTHQGHCGVCSTTHDLAAYLSENTTNAIKNCLLLTLFSSNYATACLIRLGFTDPCIDIWLYSVKNSIRKCFLPCFKTLITGESNYIDDGSMNDCLQCHENESRIIFKYYAGRTRMNSGILTSITWTGEFLYNMTHCYF